ncbi:family 16 glycoside hydrolase [Candidatus Chloroploca sp. Khr17]|uniref:family 16 glycoside hydrolase n=1 Tax=Candidatus Chloroploca sp. Khr17 TaxID=2496869 RepID=UPI00101DF923|nr:family 16 glycoside hydrolase [Candidatus Chloroploca sp. Khr17]
MQRSRRFSLVGQSLTQYALIVALMAVGIVLILQVTGVEVADVYCQVQTAFSSNADCSQEQLCMDDFAADAGNWTTSRGDFEMENGQLCMSGKSMIFNQCSQSLDQPDYVINLNSAELTQGPGYGVFFRTSNTEPDRYGYVYQNGYSFQYDPGYGGFVFERWVRGNHIYPPMAAVRTRGYDWYNQPRDIQVVVEGDTFSAYVDGTLVLTAQDSSYAEGDIGLRSWGDSEVCFDNFGVEAAP